MAGSNISIYESSQQDGQPMECYHFQHKDTTYLYTSAQFDVELTILENKTVRTEKYAVDHISRGAIKASSQGDSASLTVTVDKDNAVAKLFQGAPPDKPVTLVLYRLHDQDHGAFDKTFAGEVTQGHFVDSSCELTVKIENWMEKKVPNLVKRFTCNNVIYDGKCGLNKAEWAVTINIDQVMGLTVTSSQLANYPDNYFAGGFFYFGDNVRMIRMNKGNQLVLQYPFSTTPMHQVTIYPGCDQLFKTCAVKYKNTLNFTGFPYVKPTTTNDLTQDVVGHGVYWVDSQVVQRDTDGFIGTVSM